MLNKHFYWYAVQVMSGDEIEVGDAVELSMSTGSVFVPKYRVKKKVSRHVKKSYYVYVPLFPRYFFVRPEVEEPNWDEVTRVRGVQGILSVGETRLPIRHKDIQRLIRDCISGAYDEKGIVIIEDDELQIGDNVIIPNKSKHVFAGFSGVLETVLNNKATIELSLFGRSTKAEVPLEMLKKIL